MHLSPGGSVIKWNHFIWEIEVRQDIQLVRILSQPDVAFNLCRVLECIWFNWIS